MREVHNKSICCADLTCTLSDVYFIVSPCMCKDEVNGNPYTIPMYMYIYLYVMILIHVLQMYMYKTPFHVYTVILYHI